MTTLDELRSLGVAFVSYQESLDLTTPSGRLMMQIVGAVAEFERELIRERVRAGVANARAKGKTIGRKPVSPAVRERIASLKAEGKSVREIAKEVNLSPSGVHKTLTNLPWQTL